MSEFYYENLITQAVHLEAQALQLRRQASELREAAAKDEGYEAYLEMRAEFYLEEEPLPYERWRALDLELRAQEAAYDTQHQKWYAKWYKAIYAPNVDPNTIPDPPRPTQRQIELEQLLR